MKIQPNPDTLFLTSCIFVFIRFFWEKNEKKNKLQNLLYFIEFAAIIIKLVDRTIWNFALFDNYEMIFKMTKQ